MELAMLDELIHQVQMMGMQKIVGYYIPTKKNKMVSTLLRDFGFKQISSMREMSIWELSSIEKYKNKNVFIKVMRNDAK